MEEQTYAVTLRLVIPAQTEEEAIRLFKEAIRDGNYDSSAIQAEEE